LKTVGVTYAGPHDVPPAMQESALFNNRSGTVRVTGSSKVDCAD
jgi:hypothetical protein